MLFHELVLTSRAVGETRARSEKVRQLAALIERGTPDEIEIAVSYLAGDLPQGKVGVGFATLRELRQEPEAAAPSLSLLDVHALFDRLTEIRGPGSAAARVAVLRSLMQRATAAEQDFVVRLVVGELRQGALEGLMTEAVAAAAHVSLASIRRAAMLQGSLPPVAAAVMAGGEPALAHFRLELMRPLSPMLAQSAESASKAFERLERAAVELKMDGARVQVHRRGHDVAVFTRSLIDVTHAVPEIVEAVRNLPSQELILDGEAIAFRDDGSPQPFQVTMRRFGRRLNVDELRRTLPLRFFLFDCLHEGGTDLIDRTAAERSEVLARVVPPELNVERIIATSPREVEAFLQHALTLGHEGVMLKALDAPYDAGRRGSCWMKLKPAHTLDLVVLAAEWGSGRRAGFLSNLHLGARDPARGGFVMLGKTFKGMTDALLAWQTARFQALELSRDAWTVYVRPELVVEIAFDGVQTSPHYPGGVALRFARVKRYRDDKTAEDADTIDTVRAIHARAPSPGTADVPDDTNA
jgi:DNA ligase-1